VSAQTEQARADPGVIAGLPSGSGIPRWRAPWWLARKRGQSIKDESPQEYEAHSSCVGPVDCLAGHVASVRLLPAGDETQALLAAGRLLLQDSQKERPSWAPLGPGPGLDDLDIFCELKGRIRRG
jgi:hypothetical protein